MSLPRHWVEGRMSRQPLPPPIDHFCQHAIEGANSLRCSTCHLIDKSLAGYFPVACGIPAHKGSILGYCDASSSLIEGVALSPIPTRMIRGRSLYLERETASHSSPVVVSRTRHTVTSYPGPLLDHFDHTRRQIRIGNFLDGFSWTASIRETSRAEGADLAPKRATVSRSPSMKRGCKDSRP